MARGDRVRGAVAAGHPATATAAADVLRCGGNAFDATIAALWMACVAEPVLASPAGGGFVLVKPAGAPAEVFDFFADTPLAPPPGGAGGMRTVDADFGPATQSFHIGPGTTATPGMVPGLFAVHDALGVLAMADLLAPAARLAREGLEITPFQARLFEIVAPILTAEPAARALFAPDGALLGAGAMFRNPALAETMELLARCGAQVMRAGVLAEAIVAATVKCGGHLTHDDLKTYSVARRAPICRRFGAARVSTNPRPAAGGVMVLLILALSGGAGGPLEIARAIEAADRLRREGVVADIDIESESAIAQALASVDGRLSVRGTTHVSVIDADGNAAAATVTNGEGNGQIVGGFMLNNMLGEDDINPDGIGAWRPGSRLASMMAPTLIETDDAIVALGSGGSNRIRSAIAAVVARLLNGDALASAIAAPRLHVESGHLDFEDDPNLNDRAELIRRFPDHRGWSEPSMFFGGAHAVRRSRTGVLEAVGDHRRAGVGLVVKC